MQKTSNWELHPAKECFAELSKDWDALNQIRGNHVLLDSRFVACSLHHFGCRDLLLATSKNAGGTGIALLRKNKPGFWETFTPSQAPLGFILLSQSDVKGEMVRGLLGTLPGFAMQLALLSQDAESSPWFPVREDSGLEILEIMQTGRVRLEGTFEDYWQSRSSNLRHNLARQRRRLKEQGRRLELVTHKNTDAIAACIGEFGRLESSGWKAELGTAVSKNNVQGRFYRDLFEQFSISEESVIFQLLLDGKVVATDLCLQRAGMLIVLKTTYDESLNHISAALLMREDIVRQLYLEHECRVIEFFGPAKEWHTKWTGDFRPMYHINCHRNAMVSGIRKMIRSVR